MAPGAQKKFGAPMFESKVFWELMYFIEEKTWDVVGTFRHPRHCDPLPRRYATGVTLRDKMRSCEIPRALNVEPLLRIDRSQLRWFSYVSRMSQKRLARQILLANHM